MQITENKLFLVNTDNGYKNLDDIVSRREAEFVRAVFAFPASMHPTSLLPCKYQDTLELGEGHFPWELPEQLGLIESVGSYRWRVGPYLLVFDADKMNTFWDESNGEDETVSLVETNCPKCGSMFTVHVKVIPRGGE